LLSQEEGRIGGGGRPFVYPVTAEAHRGGLEWRFFIRRAPAFSGSWWALTAGDCLFNLRSALDQLIYQLHVKRCRGRVPDDAARDSSFPIRDHAPVNRKTRLPTPTDRWATIKRLNSKQRRAIEFLQPYNQRNDKWFYTRWALAEINRLNIIDKHRHLHVVRHAVTGVPVPRFGSEYGFRRESLWVPLETGAEVFRWTFTNIPPDVTEQVQMNDHVIAPGNPR
jgi:hypothetical protein